MHTISIRSIIIRTLRAHTPCTAAVVASVLLSVILEVVPPLVLARAVDGLTEDRGLSMLLAVGYFLVLAASGLSSAWREAMIVATGESLTHSLRSAMMEKMHRLPASYFVSHEAGKTAAVQVNDVDAIEDLFSSGLISMITDMGTVVAVLAVIAAKSAGLFVLLLLVLPLLILFTRSVQQTMLRAHTENRAATAEAGGILPETMHNIRSLHVYRAEHFAEQRYDGVIQRGFQALAQTNFCDALYSPVIITVSAVVIGVMMSFSGQSGAFRDWFGMSVGTAVALIAYVNQIFTPLSNIGMEIQTVQAAVAGWKRVQSFLDEPERPVCVVQKPRTGEQAVDIRDISFFYDDHHPVLTHFSLTVQKGEFVTLTGRTGAGKSTLFKLLLGLYEPQAGTLFVEGIRPVEMREADRRRIMTCVEQKVTPVPGSLRDQVTLGNPCFTDSQVWQALTTAGLYETVFRFPGKLDTPYTEALLSQGQKQLLMIARAIVSDPDILLLDEITAGLDSATEEMVLTALEKASAGRTVISISHRLSEVMKGRVVKLK